MGWNREGSTHLQHVLQSVALHEGRARNDAGGLGETEVGEAAAPGKGAVLNDTEGGGESQHAEGLAGREGGGADGGEALGYFG